MATIRTIDGCAESYKDVTRYVWLKNCEDSGEMEKKLDDLSTKKGIKKSKPTGFSSNELIGIEEDIHDVASELKKSFPGKVELKDYPPFNQEPPDNSHLIITVTLTLNFSASNLIAKNLYHVTKSDITKISSDIKNNPDFNEDNPMAVNLVIRERPPHLYGNVWSYCPLYTQNNGFRPVVDVNISLNMSTSSDVANIVRDVLTKKWTNLFINEITCEYPKTVKQMKLTKSKTPQPDSVLEEENSGEYDVIQPDTEDMLDDALPT